jgi:Tfp pilus assembly protein PilF
LQEALTRQKLEKYPADFSANFNLGDLLLGQGNIAGAITHFEAASKAAPGNVVAATQLGVALVAASRLAEAREQFQRALQLDPKFTDARYDLASVEAASRQWATAASEFKRVLSERPDDVKSRQHLGEVLYLWGDELVNSKRYDLAALRYREALVYRAGDAELHTSLGMVLAQLGRLQEARSELEKAIRINPNFEPARKALAAIPAQFPR